MRGNMRADLLVAYVRASGHHFGRFGRILLPREPPEEWTEANRPGFEMPVLYTEDLEAPHVMDEQESEPEEKEGEGEQIFLLVPSPA